MGKQIEYKLTELLAEQHEAGRGIGYDVGYRDGYERARTDMIERLRQMRRERSGSEHDVGLSVLEKAERRMLARLEDVTPKGAGA